jgi:hypothetical protein
MARLEEILQHPDFEIANIARACIAAKGEFYGYNL